MNGLSREKQIEVIAALCEGASRIRTASRLTGVNRGTVGNLALALGLVAGSYTTGSWLASALTHFIKEAQAHPPL
jgi:hypothetical protein